MKHKSMFAAALCCFFLAAKAGAQDTSYSVTIFDDLPTAVALNKWADNGLSLVTIVPFSDDAGRISYQAYFKREVQAPKKNDGATYHENKVKPSSGVNCYFTDRGGDKRAQWFEEGPARHESHYWQNFDCY